MDNTPYPITKYKNRSIIIEKESYQSLSNFVIPKQYKKYLDQVVIPHGLVIDRIEKLANDIVSDYFDKTVTLLIVLNGAIHYGTHLAHKIADALKNDSDDLKTMKIFTEFITAKSYQDEKSTGDVFIQFDEKLENKLRNKHIIVVEDTFDSGKTLTKLVSYLRTLNPISLKTTVLVQKMNPLNLQYDFEINYIGFLVPDQYVIGFGFDFNGNFRYLDHVCTFLEKEVEELRVKK